MSTQMLHSVGYLHNNIKPSNIMLDRNEFTGKTEVILNDFGVSSKYKEKKTGKHIQNGYVEYF